MRTGGGQGRSQDALRFRHSVVGNTVFGVILLVPGAIGNLVLAPLGTRGVAAAVLGALVVPVLLRSRRIDLALDQAGVLVKNYWRTSRLPWEEIAEITVSSSSPGVLSGRSLAFRRRGDERLIPAHATAAIGTAERKRAALEQVRELAETNGVTVSVQISPMGDWADTGDGSGAVEPGSAPAASSQPAVRPGAEAPEPADQRGNRTGEAVLDARIRVRQNLTGALVFLPVVVAFAIWGAVSDRTGPVVFAGLLALAVVAVLAEAWRYRRRAERLERGELDPPDLREAVRRPPPAPAPSSADEGSDIDAQGGDPRLAMDERRLVLRSLREGLGSAVFGCGVVLLALGWALVPVFLLTEGTPLPSGPRVAILALAVLATAAVLVRSLTVALVVEPSGVTIRNLTRTHRVPWTTVRAVVLARGGERRGRYMVAVATADGVVGSEASGRLGPRRREQTAGALEAAAGRRGIPCRRSVIAE